MPNEQLVSHIRATLTQGTSRDDITRSLLTAGWQASDINAAFAVVDKDSSTMPVGDNSGIAAAAILKKSFLSGRINRSTYLIGLLNVVLFLFAVIITFGLFFRVSIQLGILNNLSAWLLIPILYILFLPLGFLGLSITVRRIHDIGFSGWYAFVPGAATYLANYLAPYVGSILGLITILFLSLKTGSEGANMYGSPQAIGAWRGIYSRDPIPAGSLENRWIVVAFLALYLIGAVLSGPQTYSSIQRLIPSPAIKNDSAIKNDLATMQTEAEIYWGSHGNTYSIASSCNEGMFASDPIESKALASLNTAVGTSVICAANGSNYVIAAPLSTGWWCLDSLANLGNSGATNGPPLAGSYACPGKTDTSSATSTNTTGTQATLASERASFVQNSIQSCVNTLGPSMTAAGVPHDAFLSFCSCVSNGVVNRMTDTQFSELVTLPNNAPEPSFYKEDLNSANEACKSLLKK